MRERQAVDEPTVHVVRRAEGPPYSTVALPGGSSTAGLG